MADTYVLFRNNKRIVVREIDMSVVKLGRIFTVTDMTEMISTHPVCLCTLLV